MSTYTCIKQTDNREEEENRGEMEHLCHCPADLYKTLTRTNPPPSPLARLFIASGANSTERDTIKHERRRVYRFSLPPLLLIDGPLRLR